MSIQDLAAIAEIVGSIAVVVTLIYLAVQIRNNNRETRASTTQQILDSEMLLASQYVERANIWEKVIAGSPIEDATERRQAINLFQLAMLTNENAFHQYNDDYVHREVWEARIGLLRLLVRLPIYRLWRESPGGLSRSASFLAYLDSLSVAAER